MKKKKKSSTAEQLPLPLEEEEIAVHCFFNCKHVVWSPDPQEAHDLMECHYKEKHAQQIQRFIPPLG